MKKLYIFIVLILTIGFNTSLFASGASSCNIPLDGMHIGEYYYANDKTYNVLFTAQIVQGTGLTTFSGSTTEANTFRETKDVNLESNIIGRCTGNKISFVKTYLFEGGHSIRYTGLYNSRTNTIVGRWSIPGTRSTGGWKMTIE